MNRIPIDTLIGFGRSYFVARGFSEPAAMAIAQAGVNAQAFGITTHGFSQWFYVRQGVDKQTMDPAAQPEVLHERGATVHLTGPKVPGQVVMRQAIAMAVPKAREFGIAMVAVKKSHWVGAVGPYLVPVAEQGLLAQAWAQSSQCADCAPIGGIDATFSTNPLALAVPAPGAPMIADFSTATVAMGKVNALIKAGRKANSPIFMDRDGRLTDDPAVVPAGGSILFTGGPEYGHKGYALSLWCEALTALAGGDCNNPDLPQSQSFNLTVIDPEAFGGLERYQTEFQRLANRVKNGRKLPGADAIRLPGERGFAHRRQCQAEGVPIEQTVREQFEAMAAETGLSFP